MPLYDGLSRGLLKLANQYLGAHLYPDVVQHSGNLLLYVVQNIRQIERELLRHLQNLRSPSIRGY